MHASAGVLRGDLGRALAPAALTEVVTAVAQLASDSLERGARLALAGYAAKEPARLSVQICHELTVTRGSHGPKRARLALLRTGM